VPIRSNACSELTRFWLQTRHGCAVDEGIAVPVPYALSDIDLLAIHPRLERWGLPDGSPMGALQRPKRANGGQSAAGTWKSVQGWQNPAVRTGSIVVGPQGIEP
jgi:hypothetical protein